MFSGKNAQQSNKNAKNVKMHKKATLPLLSKGVSTEKIFGELFCWKLTLPFPKKLFGWSFVWELTLPSPFQDMNHWTTRIIFSFIDAVSVSGRMSIWDTLQPEKITYIILAFRINFLKNRQEASITWCDIFCPKFGQKMPKMITSHDVLEPLKQALSASRDVIISG